MVDQVSAFNFDSTALCRDEGFIAWRQFMARMFHIDPSRIVAELPRGSASLRSVGSVMTNLSSFNAQKLSRDRRRIDTTPDHLVLQTYQSGGFKGFIGAQPVRITRGQVAICDLRRTLDVEAMRSSTVGISIPRHLIGGTLVDRLPPCLDLRRERLLKARIGALHRSLPRLGSSDIPSITDGLLQAVQRLFDPSSCSDVLEGAELDDDHLAIAEQAIASLLHLPSLNPEMLADRIGVSRASLYRLFAPHGGIMQRVWVMRLENVKAALQMSNEPRTLTKIALENGFKSVAHLSRSFRQHYGLAPREWRAQHVAQMPEKWTEESTRLDDWWRAIGC